MDPEAADFRLSGLHLLVTETVFIPSFPVTKNDTSGPGEAAAGDFAQLMNSQGQMCDTSQLCLPTSLLCCVFSRIPGEWLGLLPDSLECPQPGDTHGLGWGCGVTAWGSLCS